MKHISVAVSVVIFFGQLTTTNSVQHSLLMGGDTRAQNYSSTLEMISADHSCQPPSLPDLPQGKQSASAALLGSSLIHCGGFDGIAAWEYEGTCFSFPLGTVSSRWAVMENMKVARWSFGLTAIGGRLYATGGYNSWASYSSVESFSPATGWVEEDNMELVDYIGFPLPRFHHCAVALGSWLVVLGGLVGDIGETSSTVQAFDTERAFDDAGWFFLSRMSTPRAGLACHTGDFGGQLGIYVAGGHTEEAGVLDTVEFYTANMGSWQNLGQLNTARSFHSLSIVNNQMVVAGGDNEIASIEAFDGTIWIQMESLKVGRDHHAAVSIPENLLPCRT